MEKQPKQFTPSQKLRFALYDLWNAKVGAGSISFDEFYNKRMEELERAVRDEILFDNAVTFSSAAHIPAIDMNTMKEAINILSELKASDDPIERISTSEYGLKVLEEYTSKDSSEENQVSYVGQLYGLPVFVDQELPKNQFKLIHQSGAEEVFLFPEPTS